MSLSNASVLSPDRYKASGVDQDQPIKVIRVYESMRRSSIEVNLSSY